jgi:hypothetical protein
MRPDFQQWRGYHEHDDRRDLGAQSMLSQERDRIAAFLEGAVTAGASSQDVSLLVATAVRGIDQALTPIIGQRGMAALYKRSVHLCRPKHPWLPVAADVAESAADLTPLTHALAMASSADAASAGTALLESFRDLLTTLIGELLTERLLRPVWVTFLSGPPALDKQS